MLEPVPLYVFLLKILTFLFYLKDWRTGREWKVKLDEGEFVSFEGDKTKGKSTVRKGAARSSDLKDSKNSMRRKGIIKAVTNKY